MTGVSAGVRQGEQPQSKAENLIGLQKMMDVILICQICRRPL